MTATQRISGPPGLICRSLVPGRGRWEVEGLRRSRHAAAFEALARRIDGVIAASANPISGRVLVDFRADVAADDIALALRRAATEAFSQVVGLPQQPAATREWSSRVATSALVGAASGGIVALASFGIATSIGIGVFAVAACYVGTGAWAAVQEKIGPASTPQGAAIRVMIARHRRDFLLAGLTEIGASALGVARIVVLGAGINAAMGGPALLGLPLAGMSSGFVLIAVSVGLLFARSWLRIEGQRRWALASRKLQHELRMAAFMAFQAQNMTFLEEHAPSELLALLNADINQIDQAFDAGWSLFGSATYVVLLFACVVAIGSQIAWIALLPIPLTVALSLALYPPMRRAVERMAAASGSLSGELRQSIDGAATIKSFTAEGAEASRVGALSSAYRDVSSDAVEVMSRLPIYLEVAGLSSTTLMYGVTSSLGATTGMQVGTFVSLNQIVNHIFVTLLSVGPQVDKLQHGLGAIARVQNLLTAPAAPDAAKPVWRGTFNTAPAVACRDVAFIYPRAKAPALDGLSIEIPAGAVVAVVGLSGSGKSTLVKLLLRLYEPGRGAITLDGVDIRQIPVARLRGAISVVSQDPFLFNRTIADNIRLGDARATDAEVVEAARLARAAEFIERLPQGYQTMLGPSGVALSGGERQRIAIARSLLKKAKIIVFDEATSSLDSNTELDFREAVRPFLTGCTVILVAHRLSAVKDADLILVLENGQMIERGIHKELVKAGGRYASLWATQLGNRFEKKFEIEILQ